MRLAVLAVLAAPVAAPAMAQEAPFAEAHAAAQRAFVLPGLAINAGADLVAGEAAVMALLPTLEGVWLRGLEIMGPDLAELDPGALAEGCANRGATLALTGPRGFELSAPIGEPSGGTFVERFDLVIGNTFLRSFDEAGVLRRVFGEEAEAADMAGPRVSLLAYAGRGEVLLYHPSPDLLVLAMPGRPAEFWMRCA